MPPRSSSPICERSFDLTLIEIGRRDIPQCSPKHFIMQMFYRTFSNGRRPSELGSEKKIAAAINQEIEVARSLSKILIVTDSTKTFWINAINGERIRDMDGNELRL